MPHPITWERGDPGYWQAFTVPRDTPRQRLASRPAAWITGTARLGYHGGLGGSCDATFHARTIPALKGQIEQFLSLAVV